MSKSETIAIKRGVLTYPKLSKPDTKFRPEGVYQADIKIKEADAKPYIERLRQVYRDHVGKAHPSKPDRSAKGTLWYYEMDSEGNETGYVVFKIRARNIVRADGKLWDRKPMLVDAKRQPCPEDINPWGGTVATVKAEIYLGNSRQYGPSVSLQPLIVQVIDLVTGKGNAPDLDDLDEEDGYESPVGDLDDEVGDGPATDYSADY